MGKEAIASFPLFGGIGNVEWEYDRSLFCLVRIAGRLRYKFAQTNYKTAFCAPGWGPPLGSLR